MIHITNYIIDQIYAYFLCLGNSLSSELLLALNSKENLLHFTNQKVILHSNSNTDQSCPQYKIFYAAHNI